MEVQILKSVGQKNGVIIQTSPTRPYNAPSAKHALNKFIQDVLTKTKIDASEMNTETPTLRFTSLSGDVLEIAFNSYKKINGKELNLENYPLLKNPWMEQEIDGNLTLQHKGEKRTYDFKNWQIIQ